MTVDYNAKLKHANINLHIEFDADNVNDCEYADRILDKLFPEEDFDLQVKEKNQDDMPGGYIQRAIQDCAESWTNWVKNYLKQ